MEYKSIRDDYLYWISQKIVDDYHDPRDYSELLYCLDSIDYTYYNPLDSNRAIDGIDLRYRYGEEEGHSNGYISDHLDDHKCSVLEMMVALVLRVSENILYDPDSDDKSGVIFWGIIKNLGLEELKNDNFKRSIVWIKVKNFMSGRYESNGEGGLFTIKNPSKDVRDVELWCQTTWYISENYL